MGVCRLQDGDYSRVHRLDGRENVASQSRYNRGGDTDWNRVPSLINDVLPNGASCRHKYVLVTGGDDDRRLLQFLVFI